MTTPRSQSRVAPAPLSVDDLLFHLRAIAGARLSDPEIAHGDADALLLEYINDPRVTEAFHAIEKWYA